jgi:membrane-associated protease RseP (regulator of RpoE activity)
LKGWLSISVSLRNGYKKEGMKILLFLLVAFVALTATISGLVMIANPVDGGILNLPKELLSNTPFKNFLLPGILLTGLVGCVNIMAIVRQIQQHPHRYNWAIAGGVMISGWIIVQMIMINALTWLQLVYLGTGVLIALTAYQLKGKWAV